MGAYGEALRALASLSLKGLRANYGPAELPERLLPAQLPALLVLPGDFVGGQARAPLFGERGGLEALAFRKAAATVALRPWHLLLVAERGAGYGLRSQLPPLVALLDGYFQALAADVTLGGRLLEPAQVDAECGVFEYGGGAYSGCLLRHFWKLALP